MGDLHYDYTSIKAEGEAAGLMWRDDFAAMADTAFHNLELTQAQVEGVLRIYIALLVAGAQSPGATS